MVCIYCSGPTHIINSRKQRRSNSTWRRRQCDHCKATFTTIERPDLAKSLVVQVNSRFKAFSREKLFLSIFRSCGHRTRPIEDATALTDTVVARLLKDGKAQLSRSEIITVTTLILKRFDKAAAVQYTAYHPRT